MLLPGSPCVSIVTEGFLNKKDQFLYFIVIKCKLAYIAGKADVIFRQLYRCKNYPNNIINDCFIFQLYEEESNFPACPHLYDKLLTSNSLNQILIGISDSVSPDLCDNSIMYGNPSSLFNGVNSLNYALPCDNYDDYSRFLLVSKNDTIISIGVDCLKPRATCDFTFLSIYSIFSNPFQYGLKRKKLAILPKLSLIADAILSWDEASIIMIMNINNVSIILYNVYKINIHDIPKISSITPETIRDYTFPASCYKIHQFSISHFVLHCLTYEKLATEICCSGSKEIFIFIKYRNNEFIMDYYFDFYEKKFFWISSTSANLQFALLAISSTKFFEIGQFSLNGNFLLENNPHKSQFLIRINSIALIDDRYFYGGCMMDLASSNYSAIIYSFDKSNIYQSEYSFSTSPNVSCVKNLIILENLKIGIAVSTNINIKKYVVDLYLFSSRFLLFGSPLSFKSFNEEIPIFLNSANQIIIIFSDMSTHGTNRILKMKACNTKFECNNQYDLQNPSDAIAKVGLLNLDDELTIGGISTVGLFETFWISHYDNKNQITHYHIYGKKGNAVTCAFKISKRLQIFTGVINGRSLVTQVNYLYYMNSLSLIFTDNGNFLKQISHQKIGLEISDFFVNDETTYLFGILFQTSICLIKIISSINCPGNSIIDQFEFGCFQQCLNDVVKNSSIECNSGIVGCNKIGKLLEGFICKNDKLIMNQGLISSNPPNISGTINSGNSSIQIELNQTVDAYNNQMSIMVTDSKNRKFICLNFQSYDYSISLYLFNSLIPKRCVVKCIKSVKLSIISMSLTSKVGLKVNPNILKIYNKDFNQCYNKNSGFSKSLITIANSSMTSISSSLIGISILSLNPIGIITLMNSMNEIMTFQLFNMEPEYPKNVNDFLNTSAFFSLNFLFSPIELIINKDKLGTSDWFDNNVGSHSSLESPNFLYTFFQITTTVVSTLFLILIFLLFLHVGYNLRVLKSDLNVNYLIAIYLGIFYQYTVTALASLIYNDSNLNILTMISNIISCIILIAQLLLTCIFINILNKFENMLENSEYESTYGILYDGLKLFDYTIKVEIFLNAKLQILVIIALIFQSYPIVQLICFLAIYFISLMIKLIRSPYSSSLANFQSNIKELLFLSLSVFFTIYYNFVSRNHSSVYINDTMLGLIVAIICNEIIYSLINFIDFLVDICCEPSVLSKFEKRRIYNNTELELLKKEKIGKKALSDTFNDPSNIKGLLNIIKMIKPKINKEKSLKSARKPILKSEILFKPELKEKDLENDSLKNDIFFDPRKYDFSKFREAIKIKGKESKMSNFSGKTNKKGLAKKKIKGAKYAKEKFDLWDQVFGNEDHHHSRQIMSDNSPQNQFENFYNPFHFRSNKYPNKRESKKLLPNSKEETKDCGKVTLKELVKPKQKQIDKTNIKRQNQGNEIISVHIGHIGCDIGVEFWAKMCIEEGFSKYSNFIPKKSENILGGAFFGEDRRGSLHPFSIFIDSSSKCFSLPSSKHLAPLLDKSNIMLLENENLISCFSSNTNSNDTIIKIELEEALRSHLERCNLFQGFFITYFAGEPASTNIGLKLHEMISEQLGKVLNFDFQIFNSLNRGSAEKINYESNSAVWAHHFSNLVFPFQMESILRKFDDNINNKISNYNNNLVNKVIADAISIFSYPHRRNLPKPKTMNDLAQFLLKSNGAKIISSSLFPVNSEQVTKFKYSQDRIINSIMHNSCFSGFSGFLGEDFNLNFNSNMYSYSSEKNLVISEGILGDYPRSLFRDYIYKKHPARNTTPNSGINQSLIEFIDYDQDLFYGKEASRILYLSNSSSIISHLKALQSNLHYLNSGFLSQNNNNNLQDQFDVENTKQGMENFFNDIIESYT